MIDKTAWAKTVSDSLYSIASEHGIKWNEFLTTSLRNYQKSTAQAENGVAFARIDAGVVAYITACLFCGEPAPSHRQDEGEWYYEGEKLLNRNVVRVAGEQNAEYPSEILGEFLRRNNEYSENGNRMAGKSAELFCRTMIEIMERTRERPIPFINWVETHGRKHGHQKRA